MASPTPSDTNASSASTSDVESETMSTKCSFCFKPYRLPRILNCFHVFCQSCLERVLDSSGGRVISCPVCKTKTKVPNNIEQDLPLDYALLNFMEKDAVERGVGFCGLCAAGHEKRELASRCLDCSGFLCVDCQLLHDRLLQFAGHKVLGINELKDSEQQVGGSRAVRCEVHRQCLVEYFCTAEQCNRPRCRECIKLCIIQNHIQYHLNDVSVTKLQQLGTRIQDALSQRPMLIASNDNIQNSVSKLKAQYEVAKNGIVNTHRTFSELLNERKNDMLRELDETYNCQMIMLSSALIDLQEVLATTHAVEDFTKRVFQKVSHVQMLMFKQLIDTQLGPAIRYVPTVTSPDAVRIDFTSNPAAIQAAIQNSFGFIEHSSGALANKDHCNFSSSLLNNNHHALELTRQLANLQMSSSSGKSNALQTTSMAQQLQLLMPSLMHHHGVDNAQPQQQSSAQRMGSTEDIFSKVDMFQPTLADSSGTRTSPGTSSSPGNVVARSKMSFFYKFGEYGTGHGQFSEPSGVAVNAGGDILVADTNNHRIQVFDYNGTLKFEFGENGKEKGQLLYPNRVAVCPVTGQIVITERSPTHQIQIFTPKGEFVNKFGSNVLQHPRGLTVDWQGRILVVECKVMRVLIFNAVGDVLERFNCKENLEFPNSIATNSRDEIFISDNRLHCVVVFTYKGDILRHIGGANITNYPIGVGINRMGDVVISDNHNNFNVTVFSQNGDLKYGLESKVKHAQCFDVALGLDGEIVLASKDFRIYCYRYGDAGIIQPGRLPLVYN